MRETLDCAFYVVRSAPARSNLSMARPLIRRLGDDAEPHPRRPLEGTQLPRRTARSGSALGSAVRSKRSRGETARMSLLATSRLARVHRDRPPAPSVPRYRV